jgi:hypothetical protein
MATWIVPNSMAKVIPPTIVTLDDAPGVGEYHGNKNQAPLTNRIKATMVSMASIGRFATALKKWIGLVMVSL